MTVRPYRREAHACRIDGMIKITGGAISQRELAERLKIHRATVRSILKERNWSIRIDRPTHRPTSLRSTLEGKVWLS
ncbi:hypothetical protein [Ketogulonicigenium vulgare]|uniref:hypothetical protein n=1 Tax=Ketogulonicigenium vulgare TaxID=92945 RepID=UPI00235A0321|nr:hypothetical protein [Ketogulonicigenium vulgare]